MATHWSILGGAIRLIDWAGGHLLDGAVVGPGSLNSGLVTSSSGLIINSDGTLSINGRGVTAAMLNWKAGVPIIGDLSDGTAGGGVLSVANPAGVRLVIDRFIVDLTGTSSVAATAAFGVAAGATTSATDLIEALDVNSSTLVTSNISDAIAGNAGKPEVEWGTSEFVTGSQASGTVTGMTGRYIIHVYDPS